MWHVCDDAADTDTPQCYPYQDEFTNNTACFQIVLGNIDGASAEDVTYSLTTVSRRSDEDDLSPSQNDVSETIFKMDSLDEPMSKDEKPSEVAVAVAVVSGFRDFDVKSHGD